MKNSRVIGIVGGMGPAAGMELFNSIILQNRVSTDQEHLSTILASLPNKIVDRTDFIEGKTRINPGFSIARTIMDLESIGAVVIGMACNTAHSALIFDRIKEELERNGSRVNLLHMPMETCRYINDNYQKVQKIGLMTSTGAFKTTLYRDIFENSGYEVIVPNIDFQSTVIHEMIYNRDFGIKANPTVITKEVEEMWDKTIFFFKQEKVDILILGCTEFSSIFKLKKFRTIKIVDSIECLAMALIREAKTPEINSFISA